MLGDHPNMKEYEMGGLLISEPVGDVEELD
jgi:hypothetical protein